ncbi:hypothetical protein LCGC14_2799960, partial [marine sediment metagenome]
LDVETAPIRMERLLNAYDNIGLQLPGVVRPIYTSRWKWSIAFGARKWPHATESPLLEARYWFNSGFAPVVPPSLEWMWLPFGGWTERAMLQYAGTVPTINVGVDRCVYNQERMRFSGGTPPAPQGELTMSEYTELKALINEANAYTRRVHDAIVSRLAALERRVDGTPSPAPQPPAPGPRLEYVIVKRGDLAGNWFSSFTALLQLNPDFKTLAYRSDGSIMRRFSSRDWGDIYPPERLRVK